MQLIQVFLPLYDNEGEKFPFACYQQVGRRLTDQFGGMTAYTRSPAQGLWQPEQGKTVRDDLVVYEVLACELDRSWWRVYKSDLERQFEQESILIRAQTVELLE